MFGWSKASELDRVQPHCNYTSDALWGAETCKNLKFEYTTNKMMHTNKIMESLHGRELVLIYFPHPRIVLCNYWSSSCQLSESVFRTAGRTRGPRGPKAERLSGATEGGMGRLGVAISVTLTRISSGPWICDCPAIKTSYLQLQALSVYGHTFWSIKIHFFHRGIPHTQSVYWTLEARWCRWLHNPTQFLVPAGNMVMKQHMILVWMGKTLPRYINLICLNWWWKS